MTWKSTALVSGASVLAAWLGVSSSPGVPRQSAQPAARPARSQSVTADIQQQAEHLQTRLHQRQEFVPPVRNPFRFGERIEPSRPRVAPPVVAPVTLPPPPPPFTIAGIAATDKAGTMEYTAVLSTPAGVRLVRNGDAVDGGYRVEAVDQGGVTVRAADGTVQRLSLPK